MFSLQSYFHPSIWMLTVIPPLWRDVDAYIQVTQPPDQQRSCNMARSTVSPRGFHSISATPSTRRSGGYFADPWFFVRPILTDSGVFLLLVLQHAALCFAAFSLITAASGIFWVRLILAVAWAANPLFYALVHCVGGETLSMILVLLIGATGLKIIRHSRTIPKIDWILFGVLLWLCILTRHVNTALAALLPLTFVLLSVWRLIGTRFARSQSVCRWNRLRWQQAFQNATVAVAIGVSCIVLANASLQVSCYAANIPYRSVVGFAFLGRLKFLAALPVEERN